MPGWESRLFCAEIPAIDGIVASFTGPCSGMTCPNSATARAALPHRSAGGDASASQTLQLTPAHRLDEQVYLASRWGKPRPHPKNNEQGLRVPRGYTRLDPGPAQPRAALTA